MQKGFSALHFAARRGQVPIVQALLRAGASVASRSASGMTALHEAAQAKRAAVMQELVKAADVKLDSRTREGTTPMHIAIKDVSVVQVLLAAGAAVDVRDNSRALPLHAAADTGQLDSVKALLGADSSIVNAADRQGRTAAYLAARGGHSDCLKVLLDAGADVALVRPDSQEGCLHAASKDGHPDCVKLLLGHGAPMAAANAEGDTPLHLAAQRQQVQCVQLLLDAGARVDLSNHTGATPSDIIFQRRSAFSKDLVRTVAARQRMSRSRRQGGTPTGAHTSSPTSSTLAGIHEAQASMAPKETEEDTQVLQFQPLARNIDTLASCLPASCVPCVASFLVFFDALVHFGDFWSDVVVAVQFFNTQDETWGILAALILGISWGTTVFSVSLANSAAYTRGERGCRLFLAALGLFPMGLALGMRVVGKAEAVFFDQLRLLEVFVESIPELLLQTYVLVLIASQAGGSLDISAAQIISLSLSLLSVANAVFDSRKADILSPSVPGLLEDVFARKPWGLLARWGVLLCTLLEVASAIFLYSVFGSVFGPFLFLALGLPVLCVWAYTGHEFRRLSKFREQNSWNDGVDSRISFLYHAGLTIVSGAGFLHGRGAARSDHLRHRILAIRLFGTQEHDALLFTAAWKAFFFLVPLLLCAIFVLRCSDASLHVCSSQAWRPFIIAAVAIIFAVHLLYLVLALFQRHTLLKGSPTAPVHFKSAQRGKSRARGATFTLRRRGLTPRNRRATQLVPEKSLTQAPQSNKGPEFGRTHVPGVDSASDDEEHFEVVVPTLTHAPGTDKTKDSAAPLTSAPVDELESAPTQEPHPRASDKPTGHTQPKAHLPQLGFQAKTGWRDTSTAVAPTVADTKGAARSSVGSLSGSSMLGVVSAAATSGRHGHAAPKRGRRGR